MNQKETDELGLKEQQLVKYVFLSEKSKKFSTVNGMERDFHIHNNAIKEALYDLLKPGSLKVLALMVSIFKITNYHINRIKKFDKENCPDQAIKEIESLESYYKECIRKLGLYLSPELSLRLDEHKKSNK